MSFMLGDLPLHPLFVHLTTVAVPVAALLGLAVAAWPAARRRLGLAAPVVALVALVSTPLATSSGEALEKQSEKSALIERHAQLGDTLIVWVAPLFLLVAIVWFLGRRYAPTAALDARAARPERREAPSWARPVRIAASALLVVVAVGALVDVVMIGHAGAVAVWTA
ncbi:hypothetical protein [Brachybacterium huguangmaarense]